MLEITLNETGKPINIKGKATAREIKKKGLIKASKDAKA